VTRARHQVSTLARLLTDLGAEVWEVPVIRLASPTRPELLADVIRRLNAYRWLIFTSVNGVEAFFRELDAQDGDIRRLAGIELAAIGPATGDALAMRGLRGTVISEEYRAEGIVFALQGKIMPGDEVLLVRAEDARAVLPKLLREMGAAVTDAPAYRTVMADVNTAALTAALREGTIDAITFTSSSTARNLLSLLGENSDLLAGVRLCSIGPITSNTMRERGLEPSCQAEEYCIDGLVRAIVSSMGG
jgi:uroporphyrinogen III methyltransferase/synthase